MSRNADGSVTGAKCQYSDASQTFWVVPNGPIRSSIDDDCLNSNRMKFEACTGATNQNFAYISRGPNHAKAHAMKIGTSNKCFNVAMGSATLGGCDAGIVYP